MTDAAIEQRSQEKRKGAARVRWRVIGMIGVVIVGFFLWWRNGGREQIFFALQPGFKVVKLDKQTRTMLVSRMNETYLVNCAESCDLFDVGKTYRMRDEGRVLRLLRKGQTIELPILQEHIEFETEPGGHG